MESVEIPGILAVYRRSGDSCDPSSDRVQYELCALVQAGQVVAAHFGLCSCKTVLEDREDIVAVYLSSVVTFGGFIAHRAFSVEGMVDPRSHYMCGVYANCILL